MNKIEASLRDRIGQDLAADEIALNEGRNAFERRKENPQKKMVGLVLSSSEVPIHRNFVYLLKQQIGIMTTALKPLISGQVIALARADLTHSSIGTELEVGQLDGKQKRLAAKIVPSQF